MFYQVMSFERAKEYYLSQMLAAQSALTLSQESPADPLDNFYVSPETLRFEVRKNALALQMIQAAASERIPVFEEPESDHLLAFHVRADGLIRCYEGTDFRIDQAEDTFTVSLDGAENLRVHAEQYWRECEGSEEGGFEEYYQYLYFSTLYQAIQTAVQAGMSYSYVVLYEDNVVAVSCKKLDNGSVLVTKQVLFQQLFQ